MLDVERTSWHFRWYSYWLQTGRANSLGYRENLCHYVRVLVFWAPITWIDQHTVWDWGKLVLALMLLYGAGWIGLLIVLAILAKLWLVLLSVSVFLGVVLSGSLAVLSAKALHRKRPSIPGTVKLGAAYVMAKKHRICPFITFDDESAAYEIGG